MWPVLASLLPLPPGAAAAAPRFLDGITLSFLLVVVLATRVFQQGTSADAARRTVRSALLWTGGATAALTVLRVAGAAYLAVTNPLAGATPLLALDTFLPALLGGAAVLWFLVLAATVRSWRRAEGRTGGRRTAWLDVVPRLRQAPLASAGLIALSAAAYATNLGARIALHLLFG